VPVPSCACMNTLCLCSNKGYGWSVPTKKRRSKLVRRSKLLVQLSAGVLYQAPRYHRHGALHLMTALSVTDGQVYGQCHPRKRFLDFRTFVETTIVVEAKRRQVQTVALVLDNGSTHAPKQFTCWTQELATALNGKLTIQLYWLPPHGSIKLKSGSVCCNANSCSPIISVA